MTTDPSNSISGTTSISGTAGMPLAYEAVQSGRNLDIQSDPAFKDAISDTLETTDREGDGRQDWDLPSGSGSSETKDSNETDRLDLTG